MVTSHQTLLQFLSALYGSRIVETAVGPGISISALEAIELSTVTGSGYLRSALMPLSLRPFSKVFLRNGSFELTSSMFDRGSLRYGARVLARKYSFLTIGRKIVIPFLANSEKEYSSFLQKAHKSLQNPEDHLVLKVEGWKKGKGLEPLLELAATVEFKNLGMFTENQLSLEQKYGTPDFTAFSNRDLSSWIRGNFGIARPLSLAEATFANFFLDQLTDEVLPGSSKNIVVVGEAKVGGANPSPQLRKYLGSGYFSAAFQLTESSPDKLSDHPVLSTNKFKQVLVQSLPTGYLTSLEEPVDDSLARWLATSFVVNLLLGLEEERIQDLMRSLGVNNIAGLAKTVSSDLGGITL